MFGTRERQGLGQQIAVYGLLIIIGFIFIYPILYMISTSFMDRNDLLDSSVKWLPSSFYIQNYIDAAKSMDFWKTLGKGVIIAVNKWDAVEDKDDKTIYRQTERIREILSFVPYAEVIFISALTGQRLNKLFDSIETVIQNQNLRIKTGVLNEILMEATTLQQPPSDKGKRLRLYYITQVAVKPPTFVIFVNNKQLMHFSYTRYIENKIREAFGFSGTSLKFIIRERSEKDGK